MQIKLRISVRKGYTSTMMKVALAALTLLGLLASTSANCCSGIYMQDNLTHEAKNIYDF